MKLYATTIYNCQTAEPILVGIFSDIFKAEEQGRVWIEGVSSHTAEVSDRALRPGGETIYYQDGIELYIVDIDEYTLDEMSY